MICYGAIGLIVSRELNIALAPHWVALMVGLALCWPPFQEQMALGQWSLLIAASLIGCWALLRHGRDRLAGVLLGFACLIKLFPGLLIIYLLRWRWWAAAAASATVAIGGPAVAGDHRAERFAGFFSTRRTSQCSYAGSISIEHGAGPADQPPAG